MNNVGGKLKGVSIIVIILGVVISAVYGITIIGDSLLAGIAVIAAGILGTLIFGFVLYGLGQIVDNTDEIAEHYRRVNDARSKKEKAEEKKRKANEPKLVAKKLSSSSVDPDEFIDITCPGCGEMLSFPKAELIEKRRLVCPECGCSIETARFKNQSFTEET